MLSSIAIIWLACALIAAMIGAKKGEGGLAFIAGIILGPIGVLGAILLSGNRKPCPFCLEKIHKEAVVCSHCRRETGFLSPAFLWHGGKDS